MYCASCGSELKENSRFCEYCGTKMYTDANQAYESQSHSEQSKSGNASSTQYSSTIEINVKKPGQSYTPSSEYPVSSKSRLITFLLWLFLGTIGAHYFYAGRIGMGILWLLTGGFFGIGLVIDIILILTGTFKDEYGKPIVNWDV